MPKEFDGAIGDKIVGWLEKFENWFDEREKVEGTIEPKTRINTAVHNTKQTIFLTLRKHQNDYGAFTTWDASAPWAIPDERAAPGTFHMSSWEPALGAGGENKLCQKRIPIMSRLETPFRKIVWFNQSNPPYHPRPASSP